MIDFRNRQLTAIADVANGVESIDDLAWNGYDPQAPGWWRTVVVDDVDNELPGDVTQ